VVQSSSSRTADTALKQDSLSDQIGLGNLSDSTSTYPIRCFRSRSSLSRASRDRLVRSGAKAVAATVPTPRRETKDRRIVIVRRHAGP
jgi:hypothetical protein